MCFQGPYWSLAPGLKGNRCARDLRAPCIWKYFFSPRKIWFLSKISFLPEKIQFLGSQISFYACGSSKKIFRQYLNKALLASSKTAVLQLWKFNIHLKWDVFLTSKHSVTFIDHLSFPPGLARYATCGTTNLHLDISDAINVMVYVGKPKSEEGQDTCSTYEQGELATLFFLMPLLYLHVNLSRKSHTSWFFIIVITNHLSR